MDQNTPFLPPSKGRFSRLARPGLRPRSPETAVPAPAALIDKAARTEKLAAAPSGGAVAADAGEAMYKRSATNPTLTIRLKVISRLSIFFV